METSGTLAGIVCRELGPELWPQLEALFGKNGACGGCWCWWWRLAGVEHWEDVKLSCVQGHACRRRLVRRMLLHPAWLETAGAGGGVAGTCARGDGA
jgi:hypothetical protein